MTSLPVDLQQDEQVIMRIHRHRFFLIAQLLAVVTVGLVVGIILFAIASTGSEVSIIPAVILGIGILIAGYIVWYRYQYNEWILTNQRLIDSRKKHWFHHHMVSTDLINVENMSISKSGIFRTLFNYGDLRCETAGDDAMFVLRGIHDPASVLDAVDSARDDARKRFGKMLTADMA